MFEAIILIGPATDLFPITNSSLKVVNLPLLNKELLLINLQFLEPLCEKIYIVILKQDAGRISHFVNLVNLPIEIIEIDCYDGSAQQLRQIHPKLQCNNLIVCKGDIVTNIDIKLMAKDFLNKKCSFMTVLGHSDSESVVGYCESDLLLYSKDENFDLDKDLFENYRITLSTEKDIVQFYFMKKEMIDLFEFESFSLRHSILPKLINKYRNKIAFKLYNPLDSYIYQINNTKEYTKATKFLKSIMTTDSDNTFYSEDGIKYAKQFIKKNKLVDIKNILGDCFKSNDSTVVNCVIGSNVQVKHKSQLLSSILMNDIVIGRNCTIIDSIIGNGVSVPDNTVLIKCMVSPTYKFTSKTESEQTTFGCN